MRSGPFLFFLLLVFVYIAAVVVLAGWRVLPGYETETDFIGGMVPEAERLRRGLPLESTFHPPGFAFVLAGAYGLVGDWFAAGKLISALSGTLVLVTSYLLFRGLGGPWAGLGAVVGLLCSRPFLTYSIQATSDVYFLALFSLAGLAAWGAAERRRAGLWLLAGLLVGLCLMTRTNGITQLLLIALPMVQRNAGAGYRLRAVGAAAAGLAAALAGFLAFARLTGSNLFPSGTASNVAMNYFTEEDIAWEGMLEARARFDSLADVLLHDPAMLVQRYLGDLYHLAAADAAGLAGPLLALLFLPGLVFLAGDRARGLLPAFLVAAAAQLLLVNLKAFEARYYLFLAPWIGAGAVHLGLRFAHSDWPALARRAATGFVAALVVASLALAARGMVLYARAPNPELAAVLPHLRAAVGPGDVIVARKPHSAFEAGAEFRWLAEITTPAELAALLAEAASGSDGAVFLFYGRIERQTRPGLEVAITGPARPAWLGVVAQGAEPAPWTLYRYRP